MANTTQTERVQSSTDDNVNSRLLPGIAGTAGLRLIALALTFVMNIVLARLMGVKEYGVLTYVCSWVALLSVVGMFGMERLLVREVAIYRMQASWGLLRGLLRWSYATAILISLGLVITAFFLVPRQGHEMVPILPAAGGLLICIVMVRLLGSALQGLHRVIASQFAEAFIQPALYFILVITAGIIWHGRLVASQVLMLYVVAVGAACVFSGWQLRRALPLNASVPVQYASKSWLIGALPLFLISILGVLSNQISSLILDTVAGTAALGIYTAADRGAQLIVFPLTVVNLTLAPTFANLYQAGDRDSLQRLVTKSARLVFFSAAPIALALIFGGHWFLLIFGRSFTEGHVPLTILCIGQMINAGMGSVGFLLIMTDHGREAAIGIGIGAAVNLLLSMVFIRLWGASGAALATSGSLIIWNLVLALFVWKRLGIVTTALGYKEKKGE